MFRRSLRWGRGLLFGGSLLLSATTVRATISPQTWTDVWDCNQHELDIWIVGNPPSGGITYATAQASGQWEDAPNSDWEFNAATSQNSAEIVIQFGSVDAGADTHKGVATPQYNGQGQLVKVVITISNELLDPNGDWEDLFPTVLHEIGHAIGLLHEEDTAMDPEYPGDIESLTQGDIDEAEAAAADPPTPLEVWTYFVQNKMDQHATIRIKPTSDLDLGEASDVSIRMLTGNESVGARVLGWTSKSISVVFDVGRLARYNEVYEVTATIGGRSIRYMGTLTISPKRGPIHKYPHAVAGSDIVVKAGTPIQLDGSKSYHDDGAIFMQGSWYVMDARTGVPVIGLCHDSGSISLKQGEYRAMLKVMDYYGYLSTETIQVRVE